MESVMSTGGKLEEAQLFLFPPMLDLLYFPKPICHLPRLQNGVTTEM
jgi:hypothetical protein